MDSATQVPWIVVPLFRPSDEVHGILRQLAKQAPVVAVDDGSPRSYEHVLNDVSLLPGVTLLRSSGNKGIASALNVGVSVAIAQGATLVVCFDQDSRPDAGYIELVKGALREFACSVPIGALGPWNANSWSGDSSPPEYAYVERPSVIQSGMAFPTAAYNSQGPFDESLFIDGVDTDFCLRLRSAGYWVGVTPRLAIHHRLGAGCAEYRVMRLGPFQSTATLHSADRRYYINRNLIHLLRRFARREPRWALVALRTAMSNNLAALVLEEDRPKKLFAIVTGLWDGVCGRLGPRVETRSAG
jgi:rhamnosyltransferase